MANKETTPRKGTNTLPTTTASTTARLGDNYILLPNGRKAEVVTEIQDTRGLSKRGRYKSSDKFPWPKDFHTPSRKHRASREKLEPMFNHIHEVLQDRGIERKQFGGSIRRHCRTVGDIDMIVSSPVFYEGFDFWVAEPHYWGAMLLEATGSWKFNVWLRTVAKARGMKLNRYGLWKREESLDKPWKENGDIKPLFARTESLIFQGLNMRFIPPMDRCIRDEITKLWTGC